VKRGTAQAGCSRSITPFEGPPPSKLPLIAGILPLTPRASSDIRCGLTAHRAASMGRSNRALGDPEIAVVDCSCRLGRALARPNTYTRRLLMLLRPLRELRLNIRSPQGIVRAAFNPLQKTRMRPIASGPGQPMMNGIDVNVIEMPLEITLIADRMLPESPLPDALLALCAPTLVSSGSAIDLDVRACKCFFHQAPTRRKICVAIGQRPKLCRWSGRTT